MFLMVSSSRNLTKKKTKRKVGKRKTAKRSRKRKIPKKKNLKAAKSDEEVIR